MNGEQPAGRVTIHDVAGLAGVSTSSVSRALSGARPVSSAVSDRVRQAATSLRYQPDLVGQALRRQETRTIGVVVADITNPFFPALVKALEDQLHEAGYGLLLTDASDDVDRELANVGRLLSRRVDALIITPCHRRRSRRAVLEAARQVVTVQLDRQATRDAHYVGMDHENAVVELLQHLRSMGRASPVFIGSDPTISTAWERQQAYVRHVAVTNPGAAGRVLIGDFSYGWGRKAAALALHHWPDLDALICANDLIALGATEELVGRGVEVGQAVSVSGFDDTMFATMKIPRLTSVRQPVAQMAAEATALVLRGRTTQEPKPLRMRLPAQLVVRESTIGQRPVDSVG